MLNIKKKIEEICSTYYSFETLYDADNWRKMVDELYDLYKNHEQMQRDLEKLINISTSLLKWCIEPDKKFLYGQNIKTIAERRKKYVDDEEA